MEAPVRRWSLVGVLGFVSLAGCSHEAPGRGQGGGAPSVQGSAASPEARAALERVHAWLRPPLREAPAPETIKRAEVVLPPTAAGAFRLEERETKVAIEVRLVEAAAVLGELAEGYVVYPRGAPEGGDVIHRVTAEGTEDFVAFGRAPSRNELTYEVTLDDRVAGVRMVASTVELLDATGTPRLRMAPPYVVDAAGARHEASVGVSGCAYDMDPRAPWGRAVTAPGATRCSVRVAWGPEVQYPAVVDPVWATAGIMTIARADHAMSLLMDGRVLVTGGANLSSVEIYDPATGTWSTTAAMGVVRSRHTSSALADGRVLIVGSAPLASAEIYDPATGSWTAAGPMSVPRTDHTASLLQDGRVLVAGGIGLFGYSASAEIYDPVNDTWTSTQAPMSVARAYHTASALPDGRILVAGGVPYVSSAEIYDPVADTWSVTPSSMKAARERHTATVLANGKILIAAGATDEPYGWPSSVTAELYDASTGTWSYTGSLSAPRRRHTATLLQGGKVVVAGGKQDQDDYLPPFLASVEVYDPQTGLWSGTSSMTVARDRHAALPLTNGAALVVGGFSKSAERFTPFQPGKPCLLSGDCAVGACAPEAICCDQPCTGVCVACTAAKTGVADGTCAPIPAGADPDDECPNQGPSSCGKDGACDGAGACRRYPAGTVCVPVSCDLGVLSSAACDGAGTCAPNVTSCAPHLCANAGACATACAGDADCVLAAYCRPGDGTCQYDQALEKPCSANGQCASGACVDGVCCDHPCAGLCEACSAAKTGDVDGKCVPVPDDEDPDGECPDDGALSCGRDGVCDGAGACRTYEAGTTCKPRLCIGNAAVQYQCDAARACAAAPTGCGTYACADGSCVGSCATSADCSESGFCEAAACTPRRGVGEPCTAAEECATGHCVDGVCCDAVCAGQCETCGDPAAPGTCVPFDGDPEDRGRPACSPAAPGEPCSARRCDGKTTGACGRYVKSELVCAWPSCEGAVATLQATCDGQGECLTAGVIPCGTYACDGDACKADCAADTDCSPGHHCDPPVCVSGRVCDGDHTVTTEDGGAIDCAPYRCDANGRCKDSCASLDDCVAPLACDHHGACAPRPTERFEQRSGCSAADSAETRAWPGLAVAALAYVAGRRRRRGAPRLRPGFRRLAAALAVAGAAGCSQGDDGAGRVAPSTAEWERDGDVFLPRFPEDLARGLRKRATVELPARAGGAFRLADVDSGASAEIVLTGARDVEGEVARGLVIYRHGHGSGADIIHRATVDGTEDWIHFERAPGAPEIHYEITVGSAVVGLRLVADTLELLDGAGTPRLRMAPPYVVDAAGERLRAQVSVSGCAYDEDPRPSWGRPVIPPGTRRCGVHVRWSEDTRYPALVDPIWTVTANMVYDHHGHTASVLPSGKVLVAGGTSSGQHGAEVYDPASGTWSVTGAMQAPRRYHTASVLPDGRVLVAGGDSGRSVEVYDPATGAWSPTGSTLVPRFHHTASVLDGGRVLVAGGCATSYEVLASAEVYDPLSNAWSVVGTLSSARCFHTASTLSDGRVLFVGGRNSDVVLTATIGSVEVYDPANDVWSNAASMTSERAEHTASALPDGRILIAGGVTGDFVTALESAEIYDPAGDAWLTTGSLVTPRGGHTASTLPDGRILIAGASTGGAMSSAEVYDPATSVWSGTGPLAFFRFEHTSSALANGKVLVAGGISSSTAELWTPLPQGSACAQAGECASGSCVDGKCCGAPCNGACQACAAVKTGVADGTCAPVVAGTDPDGDCPDQGASSCGMDGACDGAGACRLHPSGTACGATSCTNGVLITGQCDGTGHCVAQVKSCAPYLCAGAAACGTSCMGDAQCVPATFCDGAACVADGAIGLPCTNASQCQSGFCVDGVCCEDACTDVCNACSTATSGGANGTCAPAKPGIDPHGDCPNDGALSCGRDGTCNGSGACRFYAADTVCDVNVCASEGYVAGFHCDGAGNCAEQEIPCAGQYRCFDGACLGSCVEDTACMPGAFCEAGVCLLKSPVGKKVCGSDHECLSGLCVDGYCCNAPCQGQCEACSVLGHEGSCVALTSMDSPQSFGRPPCAAIEEGEPCAQTSCDGVERKQCAGFPFDECRPESCSGGTFVAVAYCDGQGHCPAPTQDDQQRCEPFTCGADTCRQSCERNDDCAPGYHCDGQGHCNEGACDSDGKVSKPNGETYNCGAYRCNTDGPLNGACKDQCFSVADCASQFACERDGRCHPLPAPYAGLGCATAPAGAPPRALLLALAALGAFRSRSGRRHSASRGPRPGS